MKTKTEVHIFEINGKETVVGETMTVNLTNVWNKNMYVAIQIGDCPVVVVDSRELIKAIKNSTNNDIG